MICNYQSNVPETFHDDDDVGMGFFLASVSSPIWLYLWGLLPVNENQRDVLHSVPASQPRIV